MVPARPSILCVGNDSDLMATRCAVLNRSGYEATWATVSEAAALLRSETYDLVIVSAMLGAEDKRRTVLAVGDGAVMVLEGLVMAPELLAMVEEKLAAWPRRVSRLDVG